MLYGIFLSDECVIFFHCYFMINLWAFVKSTLSQRNGVHLHAINDSLPVIPMYLRSFILHKHAYPHLLSLPHLLLISSPSILVTCFNRTLESSCLHDVADYKQYTTVMNALSFSIIGIHIVFNLNRQSSGNM